MHLFALYFGIRGGLRFYLYKYKGYFIFRQIYFYDIIVA